MRIVSRDEDVARFIFQSIADPLGRIVRLQIARRLQISQRVARAPERLGCLLRAQLSAVPDDGRFDATSCGLISQPLDLDASAIGQRAPRVDIRTNRFAMMD